MSGTADGELISPQTSLAELPTIAGMTDQQLDRVLADVEDTDPQPEPELEPEPEPQPELGADAAAAAAAEAAAAAATAAAAAQAEAEQAVAAAAAADAEVLKVNTPAKSRPPALVVETEEEPLRNAGGSEEKHSRKPELWNIDGTEMDMKGEYKFGGQMWYLQDRAKDAIKAGRPIAGFPINKAAIKSGHQFTLPTEDDGEEDESDEADDGGELGGLMGGGDVDPYASPTGKNLYTTMMEAVAKKKEEEISDDYLYSKRSLFLFDGESKFRLQCQRYHVGLNANAKSNLSNEALIALVVLSCVCAVVQAEYYHGSTDGEKTVRAVADATQVRFCSLSPRFHLAFASLLSDFCLDAAGDSWALRGG